VLPWLLTVFVFEHDAFVGRRDDKLWKDDVCGSISLDLAVSYFLGSVGLLARQTYLDVMPGGKPIRKQECGFVGSKLCRLRDVTDWIVVLPCAGPTVNEVPEGYTSGEYVEGADDADDWRVNSVEAADTSTTGTANSSLTTSSLRETVSCSATSK